MIENKFDVIVVGGGIAGLTASSYLSKEGYKVLLCEKNEKTGGLIGSFKKNGFYFDLGIRAFENSGIIFPMLNQLGIKIDFVNNPVKIGLANDLINFLSDESLYDYSDLLKKHFPKNYDDIDAIIFEIKKVMGYMEVIYGIDNPLFTDFMKDKKYLFNTLIPWLLKYGKNMKKASKLNVGVNDYLKQFTDNFSLIDIITQHFFKNTPAFFALSYFGLYSDYCYPKGGTGILAEKLTEYIINAGGTVLTNACVTTLDTIQRSVRTLEGNVFFYKKLIWAADLKQLYNCLPLKTEYGKKFALKKEKVFKGEGADSIFSVYIAADIDKDVIQKTCGAHCFYTPNAVGISKGNENFSKNKSTDTENYIINYLDYTTYEISCPSLRDESLSPEGKTGIIISTLMDYQSVKKIEQEGNYSHFKERCTAKIIEIIDKSLIKGLKEKTIFTESSSPITIEKHNGSFHGSITGWQFSSDGTPSENRFKKIAKSIDTPIADVFQAGQWAFSPAGVPVCILTGKLAADKINKQLKKQKGFSGAKNDT